MLIKHPSQKAKPEPKHDYTESKEKSLILCQQIENYWLKNGVKDVKAWPENEKIKGRDHWIVKSNLQLSDTSSIPTKKFLY